MFIFDFFSLFDQSKLQNDIKSKNKDKDKKKLIHAQIIEIKKIQKNLHFQYRLLKKLKSLLKIQILTDVK